MKRTLLVLILLLLFSVFQLYSFDFGAEVTNNTLLAAPSSGQLTGLNFSQKDNVLLWIDTENEYLTFFMQGRLSLSFLDDPFFLADLDSLSLKGEFPTENMNLSLFRFQAGRFYYSDFSNRVISQNIDGINFGFIFPAAEVNVTFGYTGLFTQPSSAILLSTLDIAALNNPDDYFGSPRFLGMIDFKLPEIFAYQSIYFSLLFQEDLRELLGGTIILEGTTIENPVSGGLVDTQYAGLKIEGPIIPTLFYNTFFYFGTGRTLSYLENTDSPTGYAYTDSLITSFLAGLNLTYYNKDLLFSRIGLDILYGSGDSDYSTYIEGNRSGNATMFLPISGINSGNVFSPRSGNLLTAELNYSIKPFSGTDVKVLKEFQTVIKGIMFFRTTTGPVFESGIDLTNNPDDLYIGTEADILINYRPLSDFGTSLSFGIFFPNNALFAATSAGVYTKTGLDFSISF